MSYDALLLEPALLHHHVLSQVSFLVLHLRAHHFLAHQFVVHNIRRICTK
jgi:hypothetical protein